MKTTSELADRIRNVLRNPAGGVVGLVDELVKLSAGHALEIDWQPDRLRIRSAAGDWEELVDELPRKSILRAAAARIATMCNERKPNSVSPYGGSAVFDAGTVPSAALKATFVNTPAEQGLRLEPVRS